MKIWKWLLERVSPKEGEVVLDPFVGAGTTIIAAEVLSRRCLAIEIEPRFCDVAIERYERISGGKAIKRK